jgi:adenylyltransferase/sulfurtransferase
MKRVFSGNRYFALELQFSADELKRKLDAQEENIFLLDVREQWEFQQANLGGYLIPFGQHQKRMNEIDTSKEIIILCQTGSRSQRTTEFLYENGFRNVKNVVGGINAYAKTK